MLDQHKFSSVQFSSVQSHDRLCRSWGGGGVLGGGTLEQRFFFFQSFLREGVVGSSGMGKDVHSLTLFIQHFLCRPWRRPLSEVP